MASDATNHSTESVGTQSPLERASEADGLLTTIKDLIVDFIRAADEDAAAKGEGHGLQRRGGAPRTTLVEYHPPRKLEQLFGFSLPDEGRGQQGFIQSVKDVLHYSVNTWDQGFLDKLYANTTPVGVAADLLLSALNTNLHVYQVSPALTIIEKHTARTLAEMFGFTGAHSGGVSQPGGSAANQTSMVVARNNLFPETKSDGYGGKRFVLFTSAHGHYSVEKAAQMFGFGSKAVRGVPVDVRGCMRPDALEELIVSATEAGETPFYVNATAGTTVLGSYDPFDAIADICKKYNLWMHIDGSWGAPVVFSASQKHKLKGVERADSITLCPHKMMNVPLTCSFLLCKDLRQLHQGMTLPAGYLFHEPADDSAMKHSAVHSDTETETRDFWDLADLTPQCGRRGDSLKLALTWQYIGTRGFSAYIDAAFAAAAHLANLVNEHPDFTLVSENPPPCLQVCFYYHKQESAPEANSRITEQVARQLIPHGFMVDYAPGEDGKFFRAVVNGQTRRETLDGLIKAISKIQI